MVIMVTGAEGQLGHDVILEAIDRGHKCFGTDLSVFYSKKSDGTLINRVPYCHMDVSNLGTVDRVIHSLELDAVIHCASFSDVDEAEKDINHNKVMKVNVKGTENVAITCKKFGVKLLYVSSAQVFDGESEEIIEPGAGNLKPVNFYGKSRLMAEQAVMDNNPESFIVRTQWLYGMSGDNFASKILEQAGRQSSVKVINDTIGTPTYTKDLARLLIDMIETDRYGIYHAVNEGGYISRVQFAEELIKRAGLTTRVVPISSDKYNSEVKRPACVKLGTENLSKNHFRRLPPWQGAVGRYLKEIKYVKRIRGKLPTKEDMEREELVDWGILYETKDEDRLHELVELYLASGGRKCEELSEINICREQLPAEE